ncbi:hypothetical protein ZWY2020_059135 [Hordeum vulgare]|nr:hypothetical protein ZWY2020_059135 [Hordeum vulgare]
MADADELLARRLDSDADDAAGTSNLFQVMRAVEDAEATIRHQLEEVVKGNSRDAVVQVLVHFWQTEQPFLAW